MPRPILSTLLASGAALGVNAVPALGFFVAGWSAATAMTLYLLETLLGGALIALRVRLTAPRTEEAPGRKPRRRDELLLVYLSVVVLFSIVAAAFMGFFLYLKPQIAPDMPALRLGLAAMAAFLLLDFVGGLLWQRSLTLVRTESLMERSLGRVALLYFAVFLGVILAAFDVRWFLLPFIGLKTVADVGEPIQAMWAGRRSAV
jgi:hypothetical protein